MILDLCIKSLVSPLVNIALTFAVSSFNFFLTSTGFVSFEVTFLFNFFSLLSKSVFFTKLDISFFLVKLACVDLALKFFADKLLNS